MYLETHPRPPCLLLKWATSWGWACETEGWLRVEGGTRRWMYMAKGDGARNIRCWKGVKLLAVQWAFSSWMVLQDKTCSKKKKKKKEKAGPETATCKGDLKGNVRISIHFKLRLYFCI